jgi:hypothetical protein
MSGNTNNVIKHSKTTNPIWSFFRDAAQSISIIGGSTGLVANFVLGVAEKYGIADPVQHFQNVGHVLVGAADGTFLFEAALGTALVAGWAFRRLTNNTQSPSSPTAG